MDMICCLWICRRVPTWPFRAVCRAPLGWNAHRQTNMKFWWYYLSKHYRNLPHKLQYMQDALIYNGKHGQTQKAAWSTITVMLHHFYNFKICPSHRSFLGVKLTVSSNLLKDPRGSFRNQNNCVVLPSRKPLKAWQSSQTTLSLYLGRAVMLDENTPRLEPKDT